MKISVITVLAVMSVVSGQLIRGPPAGWTYYNNPLIHQSPYNEPLLDGSPQQQKDSCCNRELKMTSQRLKETSGVIGHLRNQLNALEKNTQRLAEKMVRGWAWTSKKFEETSQKSTEISNRLSETKDMVLNLIIYVKELVASVTGSSTSSSASATTDIGKMPNNCMDLQLIGHTKSGLYSVMGTRSVETVYCDFSKQLADPSFQKWIGYNDVKSLPIFFYVQKNVGFSSVGSPVTFEVENVNSGNAMDLEIGIFTTPKSGIYHFSFGGLARFEPGSSSSGDGSLLLELRLMLNGVRVGSSYATQSGGWTSVLTLADTKFNQINLESTLKLQESDRIWLEIHAHAGRAAGTVSLHDDADWHHTHFSGLLIEEDFEYY